MVLEVVARLVDPAERAIAREDVEKKTLAIVAKDNEKEKAEKVQDKEAELKRKRWETARVYARLKVIPRYLEDKPRFHQDFNAALVNKIYEEISPVKKASTKKALKLEMLKDKLETMDPGSKAKMEAKVERYALRRHLRRETIRAEDLKESDDDSDGSTSHSDSDDQQEREGPAKTPFKVRKVVPKAKIPIMTPRKSKSVVQEHARDAGRTTQLSRHEAKATSSEHGDANAEVERDEDCRSDARVCLRRWQICGWLMW